MNFETLMGHYNNVKSIYNFTTFDFISSDVKENFVSFIENEKYINSISARAVIIFASISLKPCFNTDGSRLIIWCDNPRSDFFDFLRKWYELKHRQLPSKFKLITGVNCTIHETSIIEGDVVLGDNVKIGPYTRIIGPVVIGNDTIIGSYTEIGNNGFQITDRDGTYNCVVPHLGDVKIGSNCFIGSYVNIAKSLFSESTFIGNNVSVDTFVQISHNVHIGNNTVIGSKVVLCGGIKVGSSVKLSPSVVVNNKVSISDNIIVGLGAVIIRKLTKPGVYFGNPATLIP